MTHNSNKTVHVINNNNTTNTRHNINTVHELHINKSHIHKPLQQNSHTIENKQKTMEQTKRYVQMWYPQIIKPRITLIC